MSEQKRLDRPDREKEIISILIAYRNWVLNFDKGRGERCNLEDATTLILALIPDIEDIDKLRDRLTKLEKKLDDREEDLIEAKREGKERIYKKLAEDFDEVAVLLAGHELLAQTQYKVAFQGFGKLIGSWLRQALREKK